VAQRQHTVFIGAKRATLGSVNTPTCAFMSMLATKHTSKACLPSLHVLEVHSHLCSHPGPKTQVGGSHLAKQMSKSFDGSTQSLYLKGIFLVDRKSVDGCCEPPHLVERRTNVPLCGPTAMTRTCGMGILRGVEELEDGVS
jgi:hypothetical protein